MAAIIDVLISAYESDVVAGIEFPWERQSRHFCLPKSEQKRREMLIELHVNRDSVAAEVRRKEFDSLITLESPAESPAQSDSDSTVSEFLDQPLLQYSLRTTMTQFCYHGKRQNGHGQGGLHSSSISLQAKSARHR